ncbi:MAG: hypothetical protein KDC80_07785 [Saprospiraceae bacterium]|nr:hypothetical protein [Saprospiraceae bacterium]
MWSIVQCSHWIGTATKVGFAAPKLRFKDFFSYLTEKVQVHIGDLN